jgi:hypothetical protein
VSSEYHVVVVPGGWAAEAEDGRQIGAAHPTREEAVSSARTALREAGGGELVIHGPDGTVRDRDTVFGSTAND